MALLIAGYWPTTYYPRGYWDPDYWPHFAAPGAGSGGGRRVMSTMVLVGEEEPLRPKWCDDEEVLVIL